LVDELHDGNMSFGHGGTLFNGARRRHGLEDSTEVFEEVIAGDMLGRNNERVDIGACV
jgi:hypothetical protein